MSWIILFKIFLQLSVPISNVNLGNWLLFFSTTLLNLYLYFCTKLSRKSTFPRSIIILELFHWLFISVEFHFLLKWSLAKILHLSTFTPRNLTFLAWAFALSCTCICTRLIFISYCLILLQLAFFFRWWSAINFGAFLKKMLD